MKTSMFCIAALIFLFSYVSTFDLRNKTACFPHPLIVDPPCENTEMLLPRNFILATFANKTCRGKVGKNFQSHHDDIIPIIGYCCQLHMEDQHTDYCLPSRKPDIKYKGYRELINHCTGRQGCSLDGNVKAGTDYATLQYQCIPKINVLKNLKNSSITGKTVFLYNDQIVPPSGIHCIAYSENCDATITAKVVASDMPDNHCTLTYRENTKQSTVSCSNIDQHGECQPTFISTSNYVEIDINMVKDNGSKHLLWLEVIATSETVTVTCAEDIPADVQKRCPITPTSHITAPSTLPTTIKPNDTKIITSTSHITASWTLTTNDTHTTNQIVSKHSVAVKETSSHSTDVSTSTVISGDDTFSKKFYITIIGSCISGIAALLLIGLAFHCYRRRLGATREELVKENSKTEVLRRPISDPERESVTCDNPIYETDDFKLKVRDSMVKDDNKVKGDTGNTDPYTTIEGDKPFGTNAGGRTDLGDKPFGTDLQIKRNSWVNSCPDFMSEMAVSQSLAKLDDILNAEESKGNQANDVYAKVLSKEERNKGTRLGNGELSDLYAKVVPKANRK